VASSSVFGRPLDSILGYAGTSMPIVLPGQRPIYVNIPTIVTKWFVFAFIRLFPAHIPNSGFWLKAHGLHEVGLFHRDLPALGPARELRAEFEKPPDVGLPLLFR
jgi:hypothetical protein